MLIYREAMADGGVTIGLPWDLAFGLASQTVTIRSIKILL
jgi:pyrroline-5-carboxylate reductase